MKTCTKCLRDLPLDAYGTNGRRKDGTVRLRPQCRECHAEDTRRRRENPEYLAAEREQQRERKRERYATDEEYRVAKRERGRKYDAERLEENRSRPLDIGDAHLPKQCTTVTSGGCERLLTRGYFHRKRDTADQRNPWCRECTSRRSAERHLRRKLRLWQHWDEDGNADACYLCDLPFTDDDPPETEHVIPRRRSGEDVPANLLPAHASCNRGPEGKFDGPALPAWARRMTLRGEDPAGLAALADRLAARSGGVVDVATGEILEDWSLADALSAV